MRTGTMKRVGSGLAALLIAVAATTVASDEANAFCGFYISGADTKLTNNATQVVLMRDGTRTVLSMQNNYQGPPESFAMVVPVPVVLDKDKVKTLSRELFDKIDQLDAPRLVEYWEQDPCNPHAHDRVLMSLPGMAVTADREESASSKKDLGVKIEAKFSVGEYDILILSAKDSTGLETWLNQEKYKIPAGSEPFLRPYVQRGSKFFVAKVDAKRVKFVPGPNGQPMATLSPLRFYYDSEQFALPIRLGLVNSGGAQDLVVHVLGKNQRYEVANYPNVPVPTNIDVSDATRTQFPAFYAALFDRVIEKNPRAVVTEYSWQAGSCDPCPTPPMDVDALAAFGADVLPSVEEREDPYALAQSFVLTRLHARYTKESLGADLVFKTAGPIVGGREFMEANNESPAMPVATDPNAPNAPPPKPHLERGARTSDTNNFQARYIIRHAWEGAINCQNPQRGVWGGPPGGGGKPEASAARDLAFAPRGKITLGTFVKEDNPELDVKATPASQGDPPLGVVVPPPTHTCGCNTTPSSSMLTLTPAGLGLAALLARRRRRRRADS